MWSNRRCHPDDLRECTLTGLLFHFEFLTTATRPCLQPLFELLQGVRRIEDEINRWDGIGAEAHDALRSGRCRVETAHISPDRRHLAICMEVKTLLGLKIQQAGFLYSIEDGSIIGRIVTGKRSANGWAQATRS